MSQGNDFANYAASDEANATASEDVWFVAVASDDIKQMTVDQLDEAFRLGVISAETQVWTEGMEAWAPLGEVADLDGADASDSPSASEDEEETSIARTEYDSPAQQAAAHSYASAAGPTSTVSLQSSHSGYPSGPSSFAPVTSSFAPSSSFAPTASSISAPLGLSSGPVALNVDEDMPSIRRGRRFRPERWLLAAAAIAGVGVTAYNNSDIFSSSVAVAETGTAASTALAARPYEAGGGVERGASLGSAKADDEDEAAAESKKGTIGSTGAASAPMNDAKAEADGADADESPAAVAKAAAPAKESLKGSFSKAFNKKAPAAKPRAVKARKATARRAAAKPAKAPKKAGAARAGSAFDPLNDSLP